MNLYMIPSLLRKIGKRDVNQQKESLSISGSFFLLRKDNEPCENIYANLCIKLYFCGNSKEVRIKSEE